MALMRCLGCGAVSLHTVTLPHQVQLILGEHVVALGVCVVGTLGYHESLLNGTATVCDARELYKHASVTPLLQHSCLCYTRARAGAGEGGGGVGGGGCFLHKGGVRVFSAPSFLCTSHAYGTPHYFVRSFQDSLKNQLNVSSPSLPFAAIMTAICDTLSASRTPALKSTPTASLSTSVSPTPLN